MQHEIFQRLYNIILFRQCSLAAMRRNVYLISYPRGPASGSHIRHNNLFFGLYHNNLFDPDPELMPYQIQAHIPKPPIYQYHCLNAIDEQFHH